MKIKETPQIIFLILKFLNTLYLRYKKERKSMKQSRVYPMTLIVQKIAVLLFLHYAPFK